jgi:hypothetical protein
MMTMMEDGNLKTVEGQFLQELEKEFGFTPVVARAVLKRSKDVLGGQDFQEDPPRIGQMRVLVVASREPAGKPLSQCRIVPVTVTLDAGEEDLEVLREGGTQALRRVILSRITTETAEKGGYLTEADAARLLRCDVSTIKRDVRYYREMGVYLPLRGNMIGTGKGQTHKVRIVEWWVKGTPYTEIKMRTHHSLAAIQRYVDAFGRVAILARRELSAPTIAQVANMSEPLAEQYLQLYHELDRPEHQDQIERVVQRLKVPDELKVVKKRGVT